MRHALIILFVSLLASACQSRFTTQEAYNECEEIADRTPTMSEGSFTDCVDCHERCGVDCERQEGFEPPDEYVCPEDLGE